MSPTNSRPQSDPALPFIQCYREANQVYVRFLEDFPGRKFRIMFQGELVSEGFCPPHGEVLGVGLPHRPWSPEEPNLFLMEIVGDSGQSDRVEYFGYRTLSTTQDHLLVNGRPLFVRGFIRGIKAHDHANLSNLSDAEFYDRQIRIAKDLGFNLVRWHSTIPPAKWLSACDRLGLFNQIEFAPQHKWGGGHEIFIDMDFVRDTVRATSLHPSVFAFSLGNEIHKSGGNETVREALSLIRRESPHTLILDSSGWGEFDREGNDFIVQHIAYFFPFGVHRDMFNSRDCFDINGSVRRTEDHRESSSRKGEGIQAKRHLQPVKPVIAHEVLHYVGLPDIQGLKTKFENLNVPQPKWLPKVEKLVRDKGMWDDYEDIRLAAAHFKGICMKEALERLRMSPLVTGYQMLQLFDNDRYENSNGIVDCFDEERDGIPEIFRAINGDVALLADMPTKCFCVDDTVQVPLILSQFNSDLQYADLEVEFSPADAKDDPTQLTLKDMYVARVGSYPLTTLDLNAQPTEKPVRQTLQARLTSQGKTLSSNNWTLWSFPHAEISTEELMAQPGVTHQINGEMLARLERGEKVLFLYDPAVPLEETGLPLVRDHFKPVIWDRGSQLGGRVFKHPLTDKFPHEGTIDFQFARLIEGGTKVNLDGMPAISPMIQGIDKLARDRMDVLKRNIPDFRPEVTFRRFSYLFEITVGKGRLLVCSFNLSETNLMAPEVAWFARCMLDYYSSADFQPPSRVSLKEMKQWVEGAAAQVNVEPVMNIFWEEDDQPVESVLWWEKVGIDISS
jgi:hypothetical protein